MSEFQPARGVELGGKVGLITRAPMGKGALERPGIKMLFLLYFLFQVISVITNLKLAEYIG